MTEYRPDLIGNFGKNVASDYSRLLKSQAKMLEQINAGLDAGLSTRKIEVDLLARCSSREEIVNVLSVLSAAVRIGTTEFPDPAVNKS